MIRLGGQCSNDFQLSRNDSISASTTASVSTLFKVIASGYFVWRHIAVNKYLCPRGVVGSGPTMSIAIILKGSLTTGKGTSQKNFLMIRLGTNAQMTFNFEKDIHSLRRYYFPL